MASPSSSSTTIEAVIQDTVEELSGYCLTVSAAWLSGMLLSAAPHVLEKAVSATSTGQLSTDGSGEEADTKPSPAVPIRGSDRTRLLRARCFVQQQEYLRAHQTLTASAAVDVQEVAKESIPLVLANPSSAFLANYALFQDLEKKKFNGQAHSQMLQDKLEEIYSSTSAASQKYPTCAPLHWLLGILQRERRLMDESQIHFIDAVTQQPLLWCAWEDLSTIVRKESDIGDIWAHFQQRAAAFQQRHEEATQSGDGATAFQEAPPAYGILLSCMVRYFSVHTKSQFTMTADVKAEAEALLMDFPHSHYLYTKLGVCYYHRKELDAALVAHDYAHRCDPIALEGIEDVSNVLFVKGERLMLSILAREAFSIDPHRAETNCVAGNYYAITRKHEKSLQHFKRAVSINPKCLSAWTLMGHAYLEVKNTHAAAEAYRSALAVDQRDYRAWYGLGQIYELLQMFHYALHYYWHTTVLRPTDSRMWTAVANCLEKMYRRQESITCLERAESFEPSSSDMYPVLVRRLGDYYAARQPRKAVIYYDKLYRSSQHRPEDLQVALPFLMDFRLSEAQELLEIPVNRAPSFDPLHAREQRMLSQQEQQRASGRSLGRPSQELKRRNAEAMLDVVDEYAGVLLSLIATDGSNSPGASPDANVFGHGGGNSSLEARLAKVKADVDQTRRFMLPAE